MASSRKRDYKAEYARAKAKAQAAGYRSQREYKAARRQNSVPRNASPVPKSVTSYARNADSQAWSDAHSRQKSSKFNPRWTQDKKDLYYQVFLDPDRDWTLKTSKEQLRKFLVPRVYTNAEFNERYTG